MVPDGAAPVAHPQRSSRAPARPARVALAAGIAVAALAQVAQPIGRPLYDSVAVVEPYRYLAPAAGTGQIGSPTSYAGDLPIVNGQSPVLTAATSENPPQAQLIATEGAFAVPAGVTSIHVAITPVPPASGVPTGHIAGNVYRISVTDPAGNAVPVASGQQLTVAMRGPGSETQGTLMRYAGGVWSPLNAQHDPNLAIYTVEVTDLGDFAVVDLGGGITVTTLVVAGTVGIVVAAIVIFAIRTWLRRRSLAAAEAEAVDRRPVRQRQRSRPGGDRPTSRRR